MQWPDCDPATPNSLTGQRPGVSARTTRRFSGGRGDISCYSAYPLLTLLASCHIIAAPVYCNAHEGMRPVLERGARLPDMKVTPTETRQKGCRASRNGMSAASKLAVGWCRSAAGQGRGTPRSSMRPQTSLSAWQSWFRPRATPSGTAPGHLARSPRERLPSPI